MYYANKGAHLLPEATTWDFQQIQMNPDIDTIIWVSHGNKGFQTENPMVHQDVYISDIDGVNIVELFNNLAPNIKKSLCWVVTL